MYLFWFMQENSGVYFLRLSQTQLVAIETSFKEIEKNLINRNKSCMLLLPWVEVHIKKTCFFSWHIFSDSIFLDFLVEISANQLPNWKGVPKKGKKS